MGGYSIPKSFCYFYHTIGCFCTHNSNLFFPRELTGRKMFVFRKIIWFPQIFSPSSSSLSLRRVISKVSWIAMISWRIKISYIYLRWWTFLLSFSLSLLIDQKISACYKRRLDKQLDNLRSQLMTPMISFLSVVGQNETLLHFTWYHKNNTNRIS